MIENRDFVFTGLQPWDMAIGSNARDIAIEVSKHNRVLYISTPLAKNTIRSADTSPENIQRKKVVARQSTALRQIKKNLWVLDYPFTIWPINFLPDGMLFDIVNYLNNRRMYHFARKIINQLQFKDYYLFIDNDIYKSFYAPDLLNASLSVYYRRDNLTGPYWNAHAPRLEPLLCGKCDIVVSNSIQLADAVRKHNEHAYDVGQGVDLSGYNSTTIYPVPEDIQHLPRPIIGYVGWITSQRLDADLLYNVASQRPQYTFVMVGKEDNHFQQHKLHTLSNVYFLGEKKNADVASYMAVFDVCMNPQQINELTIGNYPRKIDEYLALGKPVIATRTNTMKLFDSYVWNCVGEEEYLHAIDEALHSNTPAEMERRIEFAHTHSWENSVKKIYSHITNYPIRPEST